MAQRGGGTDVRTDKRKNLPILQDFVSYRGRCSKRERHLNKDKSCLISNGKSFLEKKWILIMNCSYNREKTSSIRTKMRPIYVRMKEFSWICLNLLEFNWINLNSWFLMFYCSLSLHFRDIWETRDGPTYRPTDGRTKPLIEMRDASKNWKMMFMNKLNKIQEHYFVISLHRIED